MKIKPLTEQQISDGIETIKRQDEAANSHCPDSAGSGWVPIGTTQPSAGDEIACCAPHVSGGMMSWAGTVTDVRDGIVTMLTKGEHFQTFVVTFDTLWIKLPSLPND